MEITFFFAFNFLTYSFLTSAAFSNSYINFLCLFVISTLPSSFCSYSNSRFSFKFYLAFSYLLSFFTSDVSDSYSSDEESASLRCFSLISLSFSSLSFETIDYGAMSYSSDDSSSSSTISIPFRLAISFSL